MESLASIRSRCFTALLQTDVAGFVIRWMDVKLERSTCGGRGVEPKRLPVRKNKDTVCKDLKAGLSWEDLLALVKFLHMT